MDLTLTTHGADQLAQSASQAAADLDDWTPGNKAAAAAVLGLVDPPVRTGRLAATVHAEVEALGFTLTAGGASAPYAAIVHARDPFLTAALTAAEDDVVAAEADYLGHVLDQLKGA